MAEDDRKTELIAELARARGCVTENFRGLREDVNLPRRLASAFQHHKLAWLAGAGLFGFALARIPPRTKKVAIVKKRGKRGEAETAVKAGLLVTTLKLALDVARPMLTKWLTRRVVAYAQNRFADGGRV